MGAISTLSYWEGRFTQYLHSLPPTTDGAHDIGHLRRVWRTALRLHYAEGGRGDPLVLLAASLFHDLVIFPKNHPDRRQSSRHAAMALCSLLRDYFVEFPEEKIAPVCHAIEAHSFSAGIPAESDEAKILQDADRMEALGAIGIARTFYTGGQMNSLMFDEEDPLAIHRPLNDTQFSLDHFKVKLLTLPSLMQTNAGRSMAEERVKVLVNFMDQLNREVSGDI